MEKVHLIGWFLLLCLIGSSATTAIVHSIAEAQDMLGAGPVLEEIGCKVYSIKKTAATREEITGNGWTVEFAEEYSIGGRETRGDFRAVVISTNTEMAVKKTIEPICEADWLEIQSKHGTIDKVTIITLAKDNLVLNQAYSAATKTWKTVVTPNG